MKKMLTILLTFIPFSGFGQIWEPEGLNLPGAWNGWTNPPASGSALGSFTQVIGGKVTKISTGTARWTTTIHAAASGGDVTGGTYEFLFTSGGGNPWANKWAGTSVSANTLQSYTFNSGVNNTITVVDDKWYTMNWKDNGYANTDAIFMETSAEPVTITTVAKSPQDPTPSDDVTVTVTLSGSKSAEEKVYVRYTTNGWSSSTALEVTSFTGNDGTVTIPAQSNGTVVSYYALTTAISSASWGSSPVDLLTIRQNNNSGSNYSYTSATAPDVTSPTDIADLGASAGTTSTNITLTWTPTTEENFDTYEIYYNTTGSVSTSDTKLDKITNASLGTRTTNSLTITGLAWSTTYYFKIRAKDVSTNTSALSNQPSATTPALFYDLWVFSGLVPENGAALSPKGFAGLSSGTVQANATGTAGFLLRRADWVHKWGSAASVNTASVLNLYNGDNGSVNVTSGLFYTFNLPTSPAFDASNPFAILETSALPVTISSVSRNIESPASDDVVTVTAVLSGSKSAEELVYIRYTTDSWSSSSAVLASVTGTSATADIPSQADGIFVEYYALTTTVASASWGSNVDILTLKANTDGGLNYSYVVGPPVNPTSGTVTDASYTDPTTLTGDLTVTGTLTIGATVNTGSNGIDLGTTGSISGETPATYIVGTVHGLANINAAPVLNFGGLGISVDPAAFNLGNTTILRESGPGAGLGTSINQSWTITPTNQPGGNPVDVDFSWPASNDNGINLGDLYVLKSNDGGLTWVIVPGAVFNTGTDPRTVSFTVTSFSEFTIGDGDTPLPIELLSWSATPGNNKVTLNWETASELNHAGFEIYRSAREKSDFRLVASYTSKSELRGKGDQGGKYSLTDPQVINSVTYYYKLVDVSIDGNRTEHKVLSVIPTDGKPQQPGYEPPVEFQISSIYPNPFNPEAKMLFDIPKDGYVSIRLFNVIGQEVKVLKNEFMKKGRDYVQNITTDGIPSGVYMIVTEFEGQRLTKKLTFLK